MAKGTMSGGSISPSFWLYVLIVIAVTIIVINAIWSTVTGALTDWSGNETVFAPIIETLFPILVGASLLLLFVAVFLGKSRKGL